MTTGSLLGAAKDKDPWLAVNLSWPLPGLGQIYARHFGDALVYLFVELLLWSGLFLFGTGWLVSFAWIPALVGVSLLRFVVDLPRIVDTHWKALDWQIRGQTYRRAASATSDTETLGRMPDSARPLRSDLGIGRSLYRSPGSLGRCCVRPSRERR